MKVEKVAHDPVTPPHFPVWWKSAFNLHPSPISKPRTLPTSTGSIWFCFLMLSHCPHMTWCLHWNIFLSHKWPQCPLLLSPSSSPSVNLLYRKGAIKKYVLAVGAGWSNCPDSMQCWLGADELWVHGMLQQHTWILPQGEEPLFFLWIHTSPEILPSETWAHFLAGSLQGLKRECFTILSVWSDNTWQVSQGRWMLFSVEAVAQEASSIGTGRLRVVPQLKYLENQSQCNVCSTYVTLSILRDFYSSQASNHNHEILHMQPIIQECARLILLTSRWWPCSMFIITGAAQAHCHASLSSRHLNPVCPDNEIHGWFLSCVESYFLLFVF